MPIPPFPFRRFTGKKLFYVPSCNIILILSQQCKRQNTRLSVSSPFSVPPALKNSALEMSNVDLSQEFSDMITTQRGFQACSRLITVSTPGF